MASNDILVCGTLAKPPDDVSDLRVSAGVRGRSLRRRFEDAVPVFFTSEASAICEKALLHPSLQLPGKPSGKNPTFVVSLDITQLDAPKASEYRKKNLAILLRIVLA
jgi:hypothetical protein